MKINFVAFENIQIFFPFHSLQFKTLIIFSLFKICVFFVQRVSVKKRNIKSYVHCWKYVYYLFKEAVLRKWTKKYSLWYSLLIQSLLKTFKKFYIHDKYYMQYIVYIHIYTAFACTLQNLTRKVQFNYDFTLEHLTSYSQLTFSLTY